MMAISVLFISILLNISGRLISLIDAITTGDTVYFWKDSIAFYFLSLYGLLIIALVFLPKIMGNNRAGDVNFKIGLMGCIISMVGAFYLDMLYLFEIAKHKNDYQAFADTVPLYLYQESWFYLFLCFLMIVIFLLKKMLYKETDVMPLAHIKFYCVSLTLLSPWVIVYPVQLMNINLLKNLYSKHFIEVPLILSFSLNLMYSLLSILVLVVAIRLRDNYKLSIDWLKKLATLTGVGLSMAILLQLFFTLVAYKIFSDRGGLSLWQMLSATRSQRDIIKFSPLLCTCLFVGVFRQFLKKKQFDDTTETDQTSGNFGTARYANRKDLERLNAYHPGNGPFIGALDNQSLYLPLYNKLTISPPGGGKTTSSSIPILLTHDGPVFVFDIKGELWAVTARFRSEVLGRQIVVIDPFGVTKGDDFKRGKKEALLKEYRLNPFDWIPEDQKQRDRMINAFAASFVINEGGFATHFDENAKILIRGYIDYMMSLDAKARGLPMLYELMSESIEEAQNTFDQMALLEGRAGAAANQINRVGADERGSILSTSYRQIDWMGDSNIQDTLSESNFDLRDFLKGNMDIFIVLPEDQVKEYNRLFRMIMSLLMSMIVQSNPSDLPQKKMLFLLEELAQLGASPDVEQCIEVMRIRGVIVWTVFQALKQIEMFEKPDLFLSVPLKQIFTNDDTPTMQWIQTLGGKKTVLTKTLSTNKGDSRQKMQAFGGSVSSGEGESIHETGVDLIQLNEIRELPFDEQFVFLHGAKPLRCKKVRYFEHADFLGKYDPNPLERKVIFNGC